MTLSKEILQQDPQMEPVEVSNLSEVGGYIAYISLDYLRFAFESNGFMDERDAQQQFLDDLTREIGDVLSNRKPGVLYSWMWRQNDGTESYAVRAIPVAAKSEGVTIVTPDVSGYEELTSKIEEQHQIIQEQQFAIEKLRKEVVRLNNRIDSNILDSCNPAD